MKYLGFLKGNLIAHRGYYDNSNGIPENTIRAFRKAIRYNYIIELDIHLLKDGNIVVFHDDNLKRLCGIDKFINDCTYDEVKTLKILNTNNYIPLLTNVLKIVDGKVALIIEPKFYPEYGILETKLMKLLNSYNGLYAIHCFYPKTLYWFKKHYNDVIRGQLASDFKNESFFIRILGSKMFLNFITKPDFISYNILAMPNHFISNIKKKKLLLGWVVNTKKDYKRMKDYCDNLICENMEKYIN